MKQKFSNTQIADVLEKAAEQVRAGWTQHRTAEYVDGQRYVCGSGAVWLGVGMCIKPVAPWWIQASAKITTTTTTNVLTVPDAEGEERDRRFQLWSATLDELRDHIGQDVPTWNDSIGQTQERVVDTMLSLAKELRNNETP